MMRKCALLFKIQLLQQFGINRLIHSGTSREKRRMLLLFIGGVLLALLLADYSAGAAYGYVYLGLEDLLPSMMILISAMITLVTTFLKGNGILFGFHDYDMIMSLPVTSFTVVLSRMASVYGMNLLFNLVALVPAGIVYGSAAELSFSSWIMLFFLLFLAPLLPLAAATLLCILITAVSLRFRHRNLVTIVLSLTLIFLFLAGSMQTSQWDSRDITALGKAAGDAVNHYYPPASLVSKAVVSSSWADFGLFTLLSIAGALLLLAVLSLFYTRLNTLLGAVHTRGGYQLKELRVSTPFRALFSKELRRYFSCSIYVLNTVMGVLLLLALSIALVFFDPSQLEDLLNLPGAGQWFRSLAPLIPLFFIGLSPTTNSSISLEGKNRWIIYSAPVETITVFDSKIAVNLILFLPCVLVSSLLLALGLKTGLLNTLLLFALPVVYTFFISVAGLMINLKFPLYDWESEYAVVKRGTAVLVSMLLGFLTTLVPIAAAILFQNPLAVTAVFTLLYAALTLWIYQRLKAVKLFVA